MVKNQAQVFKSGITRVSHRVLGLAIRACPHDVDSARPAAALTAADLGAGEPHRVAEVLGLTVSNNIKKCRQIALGVND